MNAGGGGDGLLCGAICILTDVAPADALSGRNNEHLCVMLETLPFDASRTLEEEDADKYANTVVEKTH